MTPAFGRPVVASHFLLLIARHIKLVPAIAIEIEEDRRMLKPAGPGINQLFFPRPLVRTQQPEPALARCRNHFFLPVTIDIANRQEPAEGILDGGD